MEVVRMEVATLRSRVLVEFPFWILLKCNPLTSLTKFTYGIGERRRALYYKLDFFHFLLVKINMLGKMRQPYKAIKIGLITVFVFLCFIHFTKIVHSADVQFLSFIEGDPRVPGDGILVNPGPD